MVPERKRVGSGHFMLHGHLSGPPPGHVTGLAGRAQFSVARRNFWETISVTHSPLLDYCGGGKLPLISPLLGRQWFRGSGQTRGHLCYPSRAPVSFLVPLFPCELYSGSFPHFSKGPITTHGYMAWFSRQISTRWLCLPAPSPPLLFQQCPRDWEGRSQRSWTEEDKGRTWREVAGCEGEGGGGIMSREVHRCYQVQGSVTKGEQLEAA